MLRAMLWFWGVMGATPAARVDEGMWTFDNPPQKALEDRYGFTASQAWLDHLRLSSVRFNDGGSGSFVSATGLVLTNHHVALDQLQKLSSAGQDFARDGFLAKTTAEELKCPDLELNVLMAMEDVTARVAAAANAAGDEKQAFTARKAAIAKIEQESKNTTGFESQVVTLYQGGEYWLYRYKKYTDVRVVFAPELQAAFYGGDPDNFTYPRYALDMALFRVYENDRPITPANYLKWNVKGARDGDLVFVSGNPGSTERLSTLAQLEMQRDHILPLTLEVLDQRRATLLAYGDRGAEQQRQTADLRFGIENSLKALNGEYQGLLDKDLMAKKTADEQAFRALVGGRAEWHTAYGDAWDQIAAAEQKLLARVKQTTFWSLGRSSAQLATLAMQTVQYVSEVKKPDGERLPGYHEAQLESTRFALLSPAPLYKDMDEALLSAWLELVAKELGLQDPFVKDVLGGRSAAQVAHDAIANTKLVAPEVRKALLEAGEETVQQSTDSLIVLARKADPLIRELRKWREDNIESVLIAASERIGRARFAVYGKSVCPDATFTLRLSYGTVRGYPMNGTIAPPKTTLAGLYERAQAFDMKPPFHLVPRFLERKAKLDLSTPMNFVSTCDIIGGNSGSPIVDRNGDLVGLVFDGNIESLVGNYVYNEANNRTVGVHAAIMIEALRKLYDAEFLVAELVGSKSSN
ncbi:MAG: S46 family peptidase [Planctomycetota bacterium]